MKHLRRREHERITKYSSLPGNRRNEQGSKRMGGQFNNKHEAIGSRIYQKSKNYLIQIQNGANYRLKGD